MDYNMVSINESMVLWAVRYCLGRRSYAVSDCVSNVLYVWDELNETCIDVMCQDIKRAFETDDYGMEMDKDQWQRVLDRRDAGPETTVADRPEKVSLELSMQDYARYLELG